MTLKECYSELGGSYEDVMHRLTLEKLVLKFSLKFLDDKSFESLCVSLENSDYKNAFMAAHTLKGVCQNLSFTRLFESSNRMTEALRNGEPDADLINELLSQVRADYEITSNALNKLKAEQ